jgi:aspartokinase-like uncharacterized kinase
MPMNLDAVIKIGGSLSRGKGLRSLCREIHLLGKHHRLLVVPGGGKFADQVRDVSREYRLRDTAAHHMALLAMDQYGYFLNQLIADSYLTADLVSAKRAAQSGSAAILLLSEHIIHTDPLPHSWHVTSDTIAAWVAHSMDCARLILLKDVDGLLTAENAEGAPVECIPEMTVEQLAEHSGGVDSYLARFLASTRLETWVLNGFRPERLAELLNSDHTIGTCIKPPGSSR